MSTRSRAQILGSISALAVVGFLVGCGADGNETNTVTEVGTTAETSTDTETVTDSDGNTTSEASESEYEEVDIETFAAPTGYVFKYETDGTVGECALSDEGVICIGTAPDDVPDIQVPPLDPSRPGAVFVGSDGVDYTLFEGIPAAPASLMAGQQVSLNGTTCAAVDEATLECTNGDAGFTISGSERLITTQGEPIGAYFVDQ